MAGPIRNRLMLDLGAHAVLAFPGGAGTANMVRIAQEADVPVLLG
jgi:predicted Rossmann-fold nucleotide-binding protein